MDTDVPYIHAYATRDSAERGLILLNLHRTDSLPVQITLPAEVAGETTRWQMTADSIAADNELEHDAEVEMTETTLSDFSDGELMSLPPHSMTVLRWSE